MLSLVRIEINKPNSHPDGLQHGITQRFGFADHGDYQSVVVFIVAVIQQLYTLPGTERSYNLIYLLQIASLAEVGDTFHDSVHNVICLPLIP